MTEVDDKDKEIKNLRLQIQNMKYMDSAKT
jgi:hypothetical protein